MSKLKLSNLSVILILAAFFGLALYLRIALSWDQVFTSVGIKFTGTDTYFYMRVVENLVHNFPKMLGFDPYFVFPGGAVPNTSPFFHYLIASVVWILGLGHPSANAISTISVFVPPVLGALTIIPVFFIGKTLFNKWAGLVAGALVAILPGEFLGRSILGFTDQHVVETLVSTSAIMFLIMAVKSASQRMLTVRQISSGQWHLTLSPLIYSLFAGIFLGWYLIAWQGSLIFVFLIFIFLVIQFIIDHLRGKDVQYLGIVSSITFLIALVIYLPTYTNLIYTATLPIALIIPIVLTVVSLFLSKRKMNRYLYPASIVIIGAVSLLLFYIISPGIFQATVTRLNIFIWPIGTTNLEMQPLLFPDATFNMGLNSPLWGNFGLTFYCSVAALGVLIYLAVKNNESGKTLFIIWSLVILAATLAMRRFAYYYVVNAALLTGYLSWLAIRFLGFRARKPVAIPESKSTIKSKKKAKYATIKVPSAKVVGRTVNVWGVSVAAALIYLIAFLPIQGLAVSTASYAAFAPSDAWVESLTWMKDNTPDPFSDPDAYYDYYQTPKPNESYAYPASAYGVTAWWDYGYWITEIAHRIPTSNPGTFNMGEASVFLATSENTAAGTLDKWNTKYIIADYQIAMIDQKFWALANYTGTDVAHYADYYYTAQGNSLQSVGWLFYPEYFQTLLVRLYNFGGKPVTPKNMFVISWDDVTGSNGVPAKLITSTQSFTDYGKAMEYLASKKSGNSGNWRLVSNNPYSSCVPLDPLNHFKSVYDSKQTISGGTNVTTPEIRIFEYTK